MMLPYAISANRYWRNFRGRMVVSKEALEYKARVALICRDAGQQVHTGPVAVAMVIHPRMNKDGSASRVRLDIDNALKVIFDGLNGAAWVDDRQVVRLKIEYGKSVQDGGVSIDVTGMSHG